MYWLARFLSCHARRLLDRLHDFREHHRDVAAHIRDAVPVRPDDFDLVDGGDRLRRLLSPYRGGRRQSFRGWQPVRISSWLRPFYPSRPPRLRLWRGWRELRLRLSHESPPPPFAVRRVSPQRPFGACTVRRRLLDGGVFPSFRRLLDFGDQLLLSDFRFAGLEFDFLFPFRDISVLALYLDSLPLRLLLDMIGSVRFRLFRILFDFQSATVISYSLLRFAISVSARTSQYWPRSRFRPLNSDLFFSDRFRDLRGLANLLDVIDAQVVDEVLVVDDILHVKRQDFDTELRHVAFRVPFDLGGELGFVLADAFESHRTDDFA